MEQQFKVGDSNVCAVCDKGIQFVDQDWAHIPIDGPQPRHFASPKYAALYPIAAPQAKLSEAHQIIDDLQASLHAAEKRIEDMETELAEMTIAHDNRGMGALALAEKRGQTITELVDEKIALRRQLEDAQAERDCYKAGFNAADIALKHTTEQASQLHEQLSYAQATILKQAQRMAHLEAELYDLKAAVARDAAVEWIPVADHTALMTQLAALVADLVDDGDCWFDHNGHCQEHGWFDTETACPHGRAKALGLGE